MSIAAESLPSAALEPRDNEALEFLRRVVPAGGGFNIVAIDPDRGSIVARPFTAATIDQAPTWIEQRQRERMNIYWSVNPLKRHMDKKAEKTDVAAMAWLHVDIDDTGADVLDRLRAYPPAPTCIVFSGGGYQGFWKLAEPVQLNGSAEPQEDYNRYIEREFAGDHCHNIDRIMRVPGTTNFPSAKKREKGRVPTPARLIEFHEDREYELADFTPLEKSSSDRHPSGGKPVGIGEDRSADLLKRVSEDVRKGLPDYQIIAKHREHPHAREQSDPDRAVQRCIDRAKESGDAGKHEESQRDPLADIRASILSDLSAGPEAIDAATGPTFVSYPRFPVAGASFAGSGGTGKTSCVLNEFVPIVAGGELYGQPIDKQGPCALVTAEDGADYARYLLKRVLTDGANLGVFPDNVVRCAKANIRVIGWPRAKYGPAVYVDQLGNFHRATVFDLLLELLRPINPVYVTLDPAVLFGAGERHLNDGDAFFAAMIHEAALEMGCCFQVIDHVSQNVARSGIVDQYAARGGTAKTDNARMARQLVVYRQDDEKKAERVVGLPFAVRPEDISEGRLMQLHWTKLNYAPKPDPIWLLRRGYLIEGKRPPSADMRQQSEQQARDRQSVGDVELLVAYIKAQLAVGAGIRLSQNDLEKEKITDADGRHLSRDRIRSAVQRALATDRLRHHNLPLGEVRGQRKQFLAP